MGRKSKADVRKKEILETFYIVLKEEGFENASIAKIADKMDVNPSLLIHYFKTKEEIVVSFVDFLLTRYEESFKNDILEIEDPAEQFEMTLNILYGEAWLMFSDQTVFYACYYLSTRNERIKDRFKVMYAYFKEVMTPYAQKWIDAGVVKHGSAEDVIEYFLIQNEGLTFYDKLMTDMEGFRRRSQFIKKMTRKALTSK
jgi:AcrR family transcriptional regulator